MCFSSSFYSGGQSIKQYKKVQIKLRFLQTYAFKSKFLNVIETLKIEMSPVKVTNLQGVP